MPDTAKPAGSVTASDEREAVVVAFAELVTQVGYEEATIEASAERAGVPLPQAHEHFPRQLDLAFAAYELGASQAFSAAAAAFMATGGSYPDAAHAALDELLEFVSRTPAFTHLMTIEFPRLGPEAEERREQALAQFAEFLTPGFELGEGPKPPQPDVIAQMIAGGIFEIFRRYAAEGRIEDLPEARPALSYFATSLLLGTDVARTYTPGEDADADAGSGADTSATD